MAYIPTDWKDRLIEKPKTFTIQNNSDGTVTLIPKPGEVYQEGTPVNSANMNKIEYGLDYSVNNLEEHLDSDMPHTFKNGSKTYSWGFRVVGTSLQFIYEEVI